MSNCGVRPRDRPQDKDQGDQIEDRDMPLLDAFFLRSFAHHTANGYKYDGDQHGAEVFHFPETTHITCHVLVGLEVGDVEDHANDQLDVTYYHSRYRQRTVPIQDRALQEIAPQVNDARPRHQE